MPVGNEASHRLDGATIQGGLAIRNSSGQTSYLETNTAGTLLLNGSSIASAGGASGWLSATDASYGATGNGSTDDTTALNAALTAAGALNGGAGGTCLVPAGTYKCTSSLVVPAGVTLLGFGNRATVLSFPSGSATSNSSAVALTGANAAIQDCQVNITGGSWARSIGVYANGCRVERNYCNSSHTSTSPATFHSLVFIGIGSALFDLYVLNNELTTANQQSADGIITGVNGCYHSLIKGNLIRDFTNLGVLQDRHFWGIYCSASPDIVIEDNTIIGRSVLFQAGGIHLNQTGTPNPDYGARIRGNTIKNIKFIGIGCDATLGVQITDNTIDQHQLAISIDAAATGTIIRGGYIARYVDTGEFATHDQIQLNGAKALVDGVYFGDRGDAVNCVDVFGDECQVANCMTSADRPRTFVSASAAATRLGVFDNTVDTTTSTGAAHVVDSSGPDTIVSGNRLIVGPVTNNPIGIALRGSNSRAVNNYVNSAAPTAIYTPSANPQVVGNTCTGGATINASAGSGVIISRDNWVGGAPLTNSGFFQANGDGATTQFGITHGLATTPTVYLVTPAGVDAKGDAYVISAGTTLINYKFAVAPIAGTNNVKLAWWAEAVT